MKIDKFSSFSIAGINALPRFGVNNAGNDTSWLCRPNNKRLSMYIHIPFCKSICHFCMLRKGARAVDEVDASFVRLLIKDIESCVGILEGVSIGAIYFGGGTPSMLSAHQFELIIHSLRKMLPVDDNCEITVEGEPVSLNNDDLLCAFTANNVSRISYGLQTFDAGMRELLGRADSVSDVYLIREKLEKYAFREINIDYIYNLPGTGLDFVQKDFELLEKYNVTSIDCHPLKYISCSKFMLNRIRAERLSIPDPMLRIEMYRYIRDWCFGHGYKEQFADQYSVYDVSETNHYMRSLYGLDGGEYVGIGPGSRSHFGDYGFRKFQNIDAYANALDCGRAPLENKVFAPHADNYITCFPKRNDQLKVHDIQQSDTGDYFMELLSQLSVLGYIQQVEEVFELTGLGMDWYQNLQEILLTPGQKEKHHQNVEKRIKKMTGFDNYFINAGTLI